MENGNNVDKGIFSPFDFPKTFTNTKRLQEKFHFESFIFNITFNISLGAEKREEINQLN